MADHRNHRSLTATRRSVSRPAFQRPFLSGEALRENDNCVPAKVVASAGRDSVLRWLNKLRVRIRAVQIARSESRWPVADCAARDFEAAIVVALGGVQAQGTKERWLALAQPAQPRPSPQSRRSPERRRLRCRAVPGHRRLLRGRAYNPAAAMTAPLGAFIRGDNSSGSQAGGLPSGIDCEVLVSSALPNMRSEHRTCGVHVAAPSRSPARIRRHGGLRQGSRRLWGGWSRLCCDSLQWACARDSPGFGHNPGAGADGVSISNLGLAVEGPTVLTASPAGVCPNATPPVETPSDDGPCDHQRTPIVHPCCYLKEGSAMTPTELRCKRCKTLLGVNDDDNGLVIERGGMRATIPDPPPVVVIVCYRCSTRNVFRPAKGKPAA
jgi:hypothetical protein